jgi:hypothetical protein
MYNKQFETSALNTSCIGIDRVDNRLIFNENRCFNKSNISNKNNPLSQLAGYENLCVNKFLLNPEEKNTYQNYPVLQNNNSFCSMNHQIFRNHTRRNMSFQNDVINRNIDFLIPDAKPMYLKMNECSLKQEPEKNCNNTGRF